MPFPMGAAAIQNQAGGQKQRPTGGRWDQMSNFQGQLGKQGGGPGGRPMGPPQPPQSGGGPSMTGPPNQGGGPGFGGPPQQGGGQGYQSQPWQGGFTQPGFGGGPQTFGQGGPPMQGGPPNQGGGFPMPPGMGGFPQPPGFGGGGFPKPPMPPNPFAGGGQGMFPGAPQPWMPPGASNIPGLSGFNNMLFGGGSNPSWESQFGRGGSELYKMRPYDPATMGQQRTGAPQGGGPGMQRNPYQY